MRIIAVIDDDIYIGNMLEEVLRREGYGVIRAYSGTEALLLLERQKPDVVLLDLMLPGLSGEEVLPKLAGIPVIIISAKADTEGKVGLLMSGAADYITKPFDINELLARIAVQLRGGAPASDVLVCGDLKLSLSSHDVQIAGVPVHLTKTEFAILRILMESPGQVFAKSVILDRISLYTPDCMESSLKVHMSNLRKKLREVDDCDRIEAVWGVGFRLKAD